MFKHAWITVKEIHLKFPHINVLLYEYLSDIYLNSMNIIYENLKVFVGKSVLCACFNKWLKYYAYFSNLKFTKIIITDYYSVLLVILNSR